MPCYVWFNIYDTEGYKTFTLRKKSVYCRDYINYDMIITRDELVAEIFHDLSVFGINAKYDNLSETDEQDLRDRAESMVIKSCALSKMLMNYTVTFHWRWRYPSGLDSDY